MSENAATILSREVVRDHNGRIKEVTVRFPAELVFCPCFAPDGSDLPNTEAARRCNYAIYAPGINPHCVSRVEFDPVDYCDRGLRYARVTYKEFEDGSHLSPETESFTTLDEWDRWNGHEDGE